MGISNDPIKRTTTRLRNWVYFSSIYSQTKFNCKQERKTKRKKKLGQNYGTDINSITLAMSLFFVKLSSNGIDGNQRDKERQISE